MNIQAAVKEFHEHYDLRVGTVPELPDPIEVAFRHSLIVEEFCELIAAVEAEDFVETIDALADIIYVAFGTAIAYGVDLNAILAEVHRSNMTKLTPNPKSLDYRDAKPQKGLSFKKPEVLGILQRQGYKKKVHLEQLSFDL